MSSFPIIWSPNLKPNDPEFDTQLFPMPLTSMEKFHLEADSREFANTIFCRLRFEGELDEPIARAAILLTFKRHLVISKTVTELNGKLHWTLDEDQSDAAINDSLEQMLTWHHNFDFAASDSDSPELQLSSSNDSPFVPQVDINSQHGMHLWFFVGQGQTMILSGIHHTAGDGGGGIQVLNDILQVYDNLCGNREWDFGLRKLDPSLLKRRGSLDLLTRKYLRHLWKQPIALFGMAKFILRKFREFQPCQRQGEPDTNFPGILGQWVSEPDSRAIQELADSSNVRVNSVVMAAVFYATQQWLNQSVDGAAKGKADQNNDWIRMVLPISYRSKSDLRLPVTNKATIVQVDRNAKQMKDKESFLHFLNREVDIVVGWQFDKIFLMMIGLMARLPGRLNQSAKDPKARGTIIFTNLGEPFRLKKAKQAGWAGNLKWLDFDFIGPIRSRMPVNFTLQRHQQRYRLSLHFDRAVLNERQAEEFLEMIATKLQELSLPNVSTRP